MFRAWTQAELSLREDQRIGLLRTRGANLKGNLGPPHRRPRGGGGGLRSVRRGRLLVFQIAYPT